MISDEFPFRLETWLARIDVTYSEAQPLMQQCITMLFCRVASVYNLCLRSPYLW